MAHSQFMRFIVPSGFFVGTATKPCEEEHEHVGGGPARDQPSSAAQASGDPRERAFRSGDTGALPHAQVKPSLQTGGLFSKLSSPGRVC